MYFLSHLMLGWVIANYSLLEKRDRTLAVAAALAPDLDALGYIVDRSYYQAFHHEYFHSFLFCIAVTMAMLPFARERARGGFAFFAAGISHLLADLVGTSWGMPLLWPVTDHHFSILGILTEGAIYNVVNPLAALLLVTLTIQIMTEFSRTPLEIVSVKHDRRLVYFVTLPWKRRCATCGRRAFFEDEESGKPLCLNHVRWERGKVVAANG